MEIHLFEDTRRKEWIIRRCYSTTDFPAFTECQRLLNDLESSGYKIFKISDPDGRNNIFIVAYRYINE
jgi:hypothetical protein